MRVSFRLDSQRFGTARATVEDFPADGSPPRVLVDQAWMPHGDEVMSKHDIATGDRVYIRLLGDRKRIEAITKTWEKEVLDHDPSITRWADVIVQLMQQGRRTLVFVNNHYAGHAPATVRRLRQRIVAAAEAADFEP